MASAGAPLGGLRPSIGAATRSGRLGQAVGRPKGLGAGAALRRGARLPLLAPPLPPTALDLNLGAVGAAAGARRRACSSAPT